MTVSIDFGWYFFAQNQKGDLHHGFEYVQERL